MKKLLISFCFAALFLMLSCNEQSGKLDPQTGQMPASAQNARLGDASLLIDESIIDDYEVRKGIIHFKDLETYNSLMKDNQGFLKELKQKNQDFISFEDVSMAVLRRAEASDSREEITAIINQNKNLIFEKDNAIYERMPGFIAEIIDPSGFVVIGKIYYRHTPEFQYIVFGNNEKWLDDAKNDKFDGKNVVRFNLTNNVKNGKTAVWGCTWLGGVTNSSGGHRRVEANLWVDAHHHYTNQNDPVTGVQIWQIDLWITSVGISMFRNSLSSNWWSRYRTNHALRAHWEVKASLGGVLKVQQEMDLLANECINCEQIKSHLHIIENHQSPPPAIITRSVYTLSNFLATTTDVSAGAKPTDCWGNNN